MNLARLAFTSAAMVLAWGSYGLYAASQEAQPQEEQPAALTLSLEDCLRLAMQNSPVYLSNKETIDQAKLSLIKARHKFTLNPSSGLSSTYYAGPGTDDNLQSEADLSLSRNLERGGSITAGVESSNSHDFEPASQDVFDSLFTLNFSQPFLQGAGILVARESLTLAERQSIYTDRNFELFKQSFAIEIASRYWRILERKRRVESRDEALKSAQLSLDAAKARYKAANNIQVLTAEVNYYKAEDDLNNATQDYLSSLDQLKLDLAIDIRTPVELVEEKLEYEPIEVDTADCLQTALARRLDLLNARDQLDDVKRDVLISKNAIKPRLDFSASYTLPTESAGSFTGQEAGDPSYSAGLSLELPLDRVVERANYSLDLITYAQRERSLKRLEDGIILDVRQAVRDLQRAENSLRIQKLNVNRSEKLLELAKIYDEQGTITKRDFDAARSDYVNAQDAYSAALVDYLIAKLELRRVVGTLYVDAKTSW